MRGLVFFGEEDGEREVLHVDADKERGVDETKAGLAAMCMVTKSGGIVLDDTNDNQALEEDVNT